MNSLNDLNVLVISQGPVPLDEKAVVEGGGLRAWSIFTGLRNRNYRVSVAVPSNFLPTSTVKTKQVLGFNSMQELLDLASNFNVVIASYSHHFTVELFKNLPLSVMKISDAYVPIHVEVSARQFIVNQTEELENFEKDSEHWLQALRLSDALLVANSNQKIYYTGLLFALGKLNPDVYRDSAILEVPFGCAKPAGKVRRKLAHNPLTILWWGGFYPWFAFEELVGICKALDQIGSNIKIKIAGAINPFVRVPEFNKNAQRIISELQSFERIELLPWVEYSKRHLIFQDVDAVICLNNSGPETKLSWRTRYVDLLEQGLPLLTNGGDPFGEVILGANAGERLSSDPMETALLMSRPEYAKRVDEMSSRMCELSKKFTWDTNVNHLDRFLSNKARKLLPLSIQRNDLKASPPITPKNLFQVFIEHSKTFGLGDAISRSASYVRQRYSFDTRRLIPKKKLSGAVFVFHQLDLSGAPLVGLDIVEQYLRDNPHSKVTILSPSKPSEELRGYLASKDLEILILPFWRGLNFHFAKLVFLNSTAIPRLWLEAALNNVKDNKENTITKFFVHEHNAGLFLSQTLIDKISSIESTKFEVLSPSSATSKSFFQLTASKVMPRTIELSIRRPANVPKPLLEQIRFILVGPTNDLRKRQLEVLEAFIKVSGKKLSKANFRDFHLTFVGVGDDSIGKELRARAESGLAKSRFEITGRLSPSECSKHLANSHVVISLSDNESFGLYIAEAMSSGAIVLRTDVGGREETLKDGLNGFVLAGTVEDLEAKLLLLLDRSRTSDLELQAMSQQSSAMAARFVEKGYPELRF